MLFPASIHRRRALVVVVAGFAAYFPALRGGWIWDDHTEIVGNTVIQDPRGLAAIWFQPTAQLDYYPIKATLQWLLWRICGEHTLGYHLTTLALHLVSALLAGRITTRLGLRHGWLVGLLFAVHPLTVDSVAWVAELKNTLSLALLLLAFDAFVDFSARERRTDYVRALAWFVGAALAKSAVVAMPVFLLLFWWLRGGELKRGMRCLAPFFLVALILGIATVVLNRRLTGDISPIGGIAERVALAGTAGAFYLGKSLWPAGQLPIYPRWPLGPLAFKHTLPWLVLAVALVWCWGARTTWGRHGLLVIAWFALLLAPAVGFVAAPYHHFTWVMDHLAYASLLGVLAAGVALCERFFYLNGENVLRRAGSFAIAALVLAFIALSHGYARIYQDAERFWRYTLEGNPTCWPAHLNFGSTLAQAGRAAEAKDHFERALALHPALRKPGMLADMNYNLGCGHARNGQPTEAIASFRAALELRPDFPAAHFNLGNALTKAGLFAEAARAYAEAAHLNPADPDAENNLGIALLRLGRPDEARTHFIRALTLRPDFPAARQNMALASAPTPTPGQAPP